MIKSSILPVVSYKHVKVTAFKKGGASKCHLR